jgi:hypothetical protein
MTANTLEQTTTTKGSKVVVEQVKQLTEIRAEIARLEKLKVAVTEEIE